MLNIEDKVYIWLSLFNQITYKKQQTLLNMYESFEELWNNFNTNNTKIVDLLGADIVSKMEFSKDDNFISSYVQNCKDQDVEIVTFNSPNYSKLLKEIDTPPLVLYCRGDISLLNSKSLGIVGTRKPTKYGQDVTRLFATKLASSGLTIVSGMADGIDAIAQQETLNVSGKTIAVLGCGINEIYPVSNLPLSREIAKKGLIVSEYKPNEKAQVYYFPARNRIIAGLSQGILIAEANEKSGTMHTKNYALDYNRNLFVVPGRITDSMSKGTNKIIKNLQASMVLEPEDILSTYDLEFKETKKQVVQLDFNDEIVYNIITDSNEDVHYEVIAVKSALEPKTLNTVLIRLEIKGLIRKLAGNYYSI